MFPNVIDIEMHLNMRKLGGVIKNKYQIYRGMLNGFPYFSCYDIKTGEPVKIENDRGNMLKLPGMKPFFTSDFDNEDKIGGRLT